MSHKHHTLRESSYQRSRAGQLPWPVADTLQSYRKQAGGRGPAGSEIVVNLSPSLYRSLGAVALADSKLELAVIGNAQEALRRRYVRSAMQIATVLAKLGTVESRRVDSGTNGLLPVTVHLAARRGVGYLVYVPDGSVRCYTGTFGRYVANSVTFVYRETSNARLAPVSFVASKGMLPAISYATSAAVEVIQNRLQVRGVALPDGPIQSDYLAVRPYQEAFANTLGHAIGIAALGHTYEGYRRIVDVNRDSRIARGEYGQNGQTIPLLAPSIVLNQNAYEQIAETGVIEDTSGFIEVMPQGI